MTNDTVKHLKATILLDKDANFLQKSTGSLEQGELRIQSYRYWHE